MISILVLGIALATMCGDEMFKGTSVTDRECVVRMPEVYENARAVVQLVGLGGLCTGWKVKHGATVEEGDLYMTTNHCLSESKDNPGQPEVGGKAIFDYISNVPNAACPQYAAYRTEAQYTQMHEGGIKNAKQNNPQCDIIWVDWSTKQKPGNGVPAPAEGKGEHRFWSWNMANLDEFALFKLSCAESRSRPVIKLSGRPLELYQGIYIVSHPRGWPQKVSMSGLETIGKQSQKVEDRNKGLQTFLDERLDNQACRIVNITAQRNKVARNEYYVDQHPAKNGLTYFNKYVYYCDSFGGSSGAPVFDALTHEAIMIHSNGGCHTTPPLKESSDDAANENFKRAGNQGTWLGEPHILEMLRKHGIPINVRPAVQSSSEYRKPYQVREQNFCPNTKESGVAPVLGNLALPKRGESNEFNVVISPSQFTLVSESIKQNTAKAGDPAMCCVCKDGSMTYDSTGTCATCNNKGGIRATAVPNRTNKEECKPLFRPMCCLCANDDVSWSATGTCSSCEIGFLRRAEDSNAMEAAIKDRRLPVKPRCTHLDKVNGPRNAQDKLACVQECENFYKPPPGLLALTATPGGADLVDGLEYIPLGTVIHKLAVDAASGAWKVKLANHPEGWLSKDAVELLRPQSDLSMGFGAAFEMSVKYGGVRFDDENGFLALTLKSQSANWNPNGWRVTRVNNERFDQMSPAAQKKCQEIFQALKAIPPTLTDDISFTFVNTDMANPDDGKVEVQADIVRKQDGPTPKPYGPGMDILARAIQDQEARLVAVRDVTNIEQCEQICTKLLNCMGFEFKEKPAGKAECRPVLHLNNMARCPAGVEFHEKVERVLQPGRDDPDIPVEPLCCMCASAEVKYSPDGKCVECGADGVIQREILTPGPCRYPAPDPLREDCDQLCETQIFPPESRMPVRIRVPPPAAVLRDSQDDDIGCWGGICRALGFEAASARLNEGELHVGEAHLAAAAKTSTFSSNLIYILAASLVIKQEVYIDEKSLS